MLFISIDLDYPIFFPLVEELNYQRYAYLHYKQHTHPYTLAHVI